MSNHNTMATNLIANRGNRATAMILSWLEANVYDQLDDSTQRETRQMILDQVNAFKDLAIDIVKSDTAYMNEVWLEKIDEIHQEIRRANGVR